MKFTRTQKHFLFGCFLTAIAFNGCSQSPFGPKVDEGGYTSLMQSNYDAQIFQSGKVLYEKNDCTFCHGKFPGRAFGNHSPEQVDETVINGAFSKVSDMRYLSSLSLDDRAQISYSLRFWKQGTGGEVLDPALDSQPPTPVPTAASVAEKARLILTAKCLQCHGAQPAAGAYANILDTQAQITAGRIKPGNAPASLLITKVADGSMPKNQKQLNSEDLVILIRWINSLK